MKPYQADTGLEAVPESPASVDSFTPPPQPPAPAPRAESPPSGIEPETQERVTPPSRDQSVKAESAGVGMLNPQGAYNCFLNVIVQVLSRVTKFSGTIVDSRPKHRCSEHCRCC